MSAAQTLLDSGFESLLTTNGETLTMNGSTFLGIVDRNAGWRFNHTPGVPSGDSSIIECKATALAAAPVTGAQITDEFGNRHRITRYKRSGSWYRIECVTSR